MISVALDIAALNPAFKAHAARGIGRYVRELWHRLVTGAFEGFELRSFSSAELAGSGRIAKLTEALPFGRTTVRQQCLAPFAFRSLGAGLLHFPAHIDAPAWCPCPYAVTVLDLIPLIFKDLYRADKPSWRFHFARWLECKAIENASLVLCISENTARDVERILGIPSERLAVTPLGVDERFFDVVKTGDDANIRHRLGLPAEGDIVLYVGGIDQRKNIAGLISVFKRTRETVAAGGGHRPILLIAGDVQSDEQYREVREIIRSERVDDAVFFTGFLPEEELLDVFGAASAFFFPSFYEGFGLPPLEAMAAGVPVVSSKRSAMPEVLGEGALLVNPNDFHEGSEALIAVLENRNMAADLVERGRRRARLFSWERTAALTAEAYGRVLRRK